jgi:hypothetical protein
MSEIEIKEAAERYANYNYYEYARGIATGCFIAGCEYADKEAYNRALSDFCNFLHQESYGTGLVICNTNELIARLNETLKK